jgi:hypothetical protein
LSLVQDSTQINEDLNENDAREDDILMHLEDLWNQSEFQ